jgi:YVTN family beta-propeller protein
MIDMGSNIDELAAKDESIHLHIRNIENKPQNFQEWDKLARKFMDKGNYYKLLYEKSKSEYAREKLESLYNESIIYYDASIKLEPNNIESWYNKGLALSNLGQYESAIRCYDKVIEIDPDYVPVWNIKGNALKHLGKFHESIKAYNQILEEDPQNIIALYNKGLTLSNLGQYKNAIRCYDKVIEIDPQNIDAINAKGLALERLNNYEEAIKCYDTVLEKDLDNIEALNAKAYALERLGNSTRAEQYYKKITENYVNQIYKTNDEAKEYQELGKYDEAIICYDRILSIDINNSNAWLQKGHLFSKLNNFSKAIECYDRIIGLDKHNEKLKREGQELNDKQIIEYYKTIDPSPENIAALNAKGLALEKVEKYDDAIQIFDIVISQNPSFVIDTIIESGNIFLKLGNNSPHNYQKAKESYNDVLKRDPNNIFALYKLHTLYSNYLFQYDKAISICKKLLKNLSIPQIQNSDKLINFIDTKSQRDKVIRYEQSQKKNRKQAKQTNLVNEEILKTKILLSEDFIKNGNYNQGRKIAKEIIKEIPNSSITRQIIVRFLIIVSYLLQGKIEKAISKLDIFLVYYRNLDIDFKIEKNQWNFNGLIHAIKENRDIDEKSTKTILRNLIDLLYGYTELYRPLLNITEETIEKIDKTKRQKRIKRTAIISLVVLGTLGILYSQLNVAGSCSVDTSQILNIGSGGGSPKGIDFNSITNKAYVSNSLENTISIIDCNVPRYYNIFKPYFDSSIQIENKPIQLNKSPFDVAVDPTTNKIYVIHQSPSPSLSIIDGNTNKILNQSIPLGKNPVDISINSNSNKIYVANFGNASVSVIDGKTDKLIGGLNVAANPLSVAVNPNTDKVYVAYGGSNNISVSKEIEGNEYIINIPLSSVITDVNINPNTNKVYASHGSNNTVSIIDGISDTKIKEIEVDTKPIRIEIDKETNQVFVVNQDSNSVSVIDGIQDTLLKTLKIPSDKPYDVEFDSETKSVYVTNVGSDSSDRVNVIKYNDDNNLNYISVGKRPVDIDVNSETNKTYVVNNDSDTLSIINSINRVEKQIAIGDNPLSVAVNPTTNKIYVSHLSPSSPFLSVIDENNNYQILKTNITLGKDPLDIAINPITNKVYVANNGDNTVSVIDGNTDQVKNKSITVGKNPIKISVDPNTNKVYVANNGDNTVSVIDGNTDQVKKTIKDDIDENPYSMAVNTNTSQVYVGYSNNFHYSVIDGKNDKVLVNNNNESVKIPLFYPCPSDIAIHQEKNIAFVSFDCKDGIFMINGATYESQSTKAITFGTTNTNIAFNAGTNQIYVVDKDSNIVFVKNIEDIIDTDSNMDEERENY